jgi:arginine exporter protein ArgO
VSHNVSSSGNQGDRDHGSLLKKAATAVGAVFLLVGILGFIPGITSHIYPMDLMNTNKVTSNEKLLGIFEVSVLHNLVHVLFGVAGLLMARTWDGAKNYLIGGGVIYLVLWLYGLVIPKDSPANFVPVNSADDWLHFVLGAAMIALGVLLAKRDREASNAYAR